MGSENIHGCVHNAENGFGFDFLHQCQEDGDEFLHQMVRVTGDETLVLFVKVKTKEQSKQWMLTHSPNKLKKFKQTLSGRKLVAAVLWDRKRVMIVEFMQQEITITSQVYCRTLKSA
jgi:hypothetical protein